MDILFVNSGPSDFFAPQKPLRNALYHNNHDGTFTDVSDMAGVGETKSFGMGGAGGDYEGGGRPHIFNKAYGRHTLYQNKSDGNVYYVNEENQTRAFRLF